jgi:hypothetical protein
MVQRILALAAGLLAVVMIGGWGHEHAPATPGQPAAMRAIRALTTGAPDAGRLVPADFRAVMGYQPAASSTGPTRADGGCSSPFGGTGYHFTPPCKQHDLGYDLLRYADRKGQPLGPWARHAVDARFASQLRELCPAATGVTGAVTGGVTNTACRLTGDFYASVVGFNSWRQGYGAPVVETKVKLAGPAAAGMAVVGLGFVPLRRRPAHRSPPGPT